MTPVHDAGEIRIDDLREPRLTDDQRAAVELGESLDVRLDESDLLRAAAAATGLSDFGPDDFRPRLRAQIAAIRGDAGLTGIGRLILRRRLVGLLAARLRLEDFVKRYPEALDVELEPPVVVVGLPRSGTTHLVNILAADPRFRSLPWWEVQEPVPVVGDGTMRDGVDPRYRRALAAYEAETAIAPLTEAMHDRRPEAIEEECELLDLDFAAYVLEWHARVPDWRDFYLAIDQSGPYEYLLRTLRVLTFLRGPSRWVLKSPQHLEQLGPLTAAFSNATIAFTHRDPVASLQSAITMLAYGDRIRRRAIEPDALAAYWVDRIERLLRACVRDRDLVPASRSTDVVFHEFMADEMGTVERIYATAGIEVSEPVRAQLAAHLAAHPRGAHGRVVYDLEGDFGLRADEVRERFAFYFERFPAVAPEG